MPKAVVGTSVVEVTEEVSNVEGVGRRHSVRC